VVKSRRAGGSAPRATGPRVVLEVPC